MRNHPIVFSGFSPFVGCLSQSRVSSQFIWILNNNPIGINDSNSSSVNDHSYIVVVLSCSHISVIGDPNLALSSGGPGTASL